MALCSPLTLSLAAFTDWLLSVRKENLFGISLIGPVLVKNPFFADHIVKLITERRKAEFKAIFYKYEERSYEMTLRALS